MSSRRSDRYGINMKRFCRSHEAEVAGALARSGPSPALLEAHLETLHWLQHERLIHLIVLVMTAAGELFAVDLALLHPETNPMAAVVMLGLAVLLGFYFAHYFFLENTTQHWYRIAGELRAALEAAGREEQAVSPAAGPEEAV